MTVRQYTGGESTHYRLPLLDPNDYNNDGYYDEVVLSELEQRYAKIIDSNLYGTARSLIATDYMTRGYGVIRESDFYLTYEDDGRIYLTIDELECIINNVYINTTGVVWNDLVAGQTYYLFLKLVEDDRTDVQGERYLSTREFGDVAAITKGGLAATNIELYMGMVTPPSLTGIYGQGYFGQGAYGS